MDIKLPWHDWSVVRKIGNGSFGHVYEIHRDAYGLSEKAALKVISIPQNVDEIDDLRSQGSTELDITRHYDRCLQQIVQEYSLMTQIRGHANVVNCEDVQCVNHEDGIGWDIFIKMELLHPLMKSLNQVATEAQVVKLGMDISNALVRCKDKGIIHRDIKPQNIFISDDGDFKLGDFGIAKTVERTTGGTRIGTYKYMAPEVYNNHPYGAGADIYSLGLVLYWLLNEKRTPFLPMPPQIPTSAEEEEAGLRRFRGEAIPAPKYGSDELKRIVLKACAYASVDRYTSATELLADLKALENVSTVPFALISVPDPMEKVDTGTDVLNYGDARETVLVENEQDTVLLNEQETMLLNQQETALLEESAPEKKPQKKKKTALWVILGAAVIGIIILLLMLKSCDGAPVDDGKSSTTKPTIGAATTAPTTGPTSPTDPTDPPVVEKVTITMDLGFASTEADGHVSYDSYGVNLKEETVDKGSKPSLAAPTRPGYDFDGWYTAQTGGQKVEEDTVITEEATYYARWTGKTVDVTYNANGGTFSNGKGTVVIATQNGSNFILPKEIPTKEGYNFMGWTDGESMVTENRVKGYVYEQTFTAMWGEGEYAYNVECVAKYEDGTEKTIDLYSVIKKLDGTYTITPEAIPGYKTPAAQSVKWDSTTPKTIKFVYTPNDVLGTVYYKTNTGMELNRASVTFPYNSTQTIECKVFAGYTPDKYVQTVMSWGEDGAPSITFVYTANTYTVTFNANGGSVGTTSKTVTYDSTYGTLSAPTRTGYTFAGWYTAASGGSKVEASTLVKITGNQTLYARWTAKTYTVTFNSNGGSAVSSINVTYDNTYGTLSAPTRTGYTFAGWYTAASGGSKVEASTLVKITGNQTLYARWTAKTYTVTFNANGGTTSTSSKGVTYGGTYGTLPTPSRTYYTFQGWYTATSGGTQITASNTVNITSAQTLYARWTENGTSGWVLASQLPSGAKIVNTKYTYNLKEYTESEASSLNGWTRNSANDWWKKTSSGSKLYATFPSGFDTTNEIYKSFGGQSPYLSYNDGDVLREVENVWSGYVYWHWTYPLADPSLPANRTINENKSSKNTEFAAFTDVTNYGHTDSKGTTWSGGYFCNRRNYTDISWWWFRFDYYTSYYTEYKRVYGYTRTTSHESTTQPTGEHISNVQKWVQYIPA